MTRKAIPKYQMLLRVRDFGTARRDLFSARSVAGKLFAAVAAAADALQQHDSTELAASGGEQDAAASKVAARAALRHQVRAIARTAAAAEMPELGATFRVSLDCNDERLLSQARTLLQEAKPFAGTFVAHELPSNFLGQLQAAVDAFERAMRERASGRDQRVAARARFEASMEAALRAVKRLNAIVSNKLNDPVGMASWNLARRIDYGRVRRSGAATPDGTTDSSSAQADAARPAARLPEPWSFVRARRRVREPAGSCSRYPWRRGTLFLTGSAGRATSQQTLHSAANREAGRHVEAWTTRRDRHDLLDAAGGAMAEISAATRAAG